MGIKEDFYSSPHLFFLVKVERDVFSKDILAAPQDLVEFWIEFGAGEIFETETIYSPSADANDDTVQEVNEHFISKGMPQDYTVFHTGMAVSAYRAEEPRYVILNKDTFEVIRSFNSIEEWYINTLRKEYAERYGMTGIDDDQEEGERM